MSGLCNECGHALPNAAGGGLYCTACGEQFGARSRASAMSGADAKRGDRVRNLATGEVGIADTALQDGRINVRYPSGARTPTERWAIIIIVPDVPVPTERQA